MVLAVVALLTQAAVAPSAERPIRVWLGSPGPVAPGEHVQVFVRTAADGYVMVLRSATDGRLEVLFPSNPAEDVFVPAGTYEVRRPGESAAFAALEPPGAGLVLAALSPTPFHPDEFVHAAAWHPDAMIPSWSGADAEGALGDIVQRMLGDGYFSYDLVSYTVAARPLARPTTVAGAAELAPCIGCSFVNVTVLADPFLLVPALVCDPFTGFCRPLAAFFRDDPSPAPAPRPTRTLAWSLRGAESVSPRVVSVPPRLVRPRRPAVPPLIGARPRATDAARPRAVTRPRTRVTPQGEVRLVMSRSRANPTTPVTPVAPRSRVTAPTTIARAPAPTLRSIPVTVVTPRPSVTTAAARPRASGAVAAGTATTPRVSTPARPAVAGARVRASGVPVRRRN
ncbi:MAG TPA: DUF4384 domain-containing protein [Gemmatimonadales bacterium]